MLKISIDTAKKINSVSPLLYGIFFEDINYAGDGGLYGELIANRSFEYTDRDKLTDKRKMCWEEIGDISFEIRERFPLSSAHPNYARLTGKAHEFRVKRRKHFRQVFSEPVLAAFKGVGWKKRNQVQIKSSLPCKGDFRVNVFTVPGGGQSQVIF